MEIYDPGLFFCVAVEKSIAWKEEVKFGMERMAVLM